MRMMNLLEKLVDKRPGADPLDFAPALSRIHGAIGRERPSRLAIRAAASVFEGSKRHNNKTSEIVGSP